MRRVKTNGEHNKKGSPEVNGVRSSTRSMIGGLGTLPELQEVLELTWCYNRNTGPPLDHPITPLTLKYRTKRFKGHSTQAEARSVCPHTIRNSVTIRSGVDAPFAQQRRNPSELTPILPWCPPSSPIEFESQYLTYSGYSQSIIS